MNWSLTSRYRLPVDGLLGLSTAAAAGLAFADGAMLPALALACSALLLLGLEVTS